MFMPEAEFAPLISGWWCSQCGGERMVLLVDVVDGAVEGCTVGVMYGRW